MTQNTPIDENEVKRRCLEFAKALLKKLGIQDLSQENLVKLLTKEELSGFNSCLNELCKWMVNCVQQHPITLEDYMEDAPSEVRETLENLLLTIQNRVATYERRMRALKEISPPIIDAERYLDREEFQHFKKSLAGAADAYLEKDVKIEAIHPGFWMVHGAAVDYSYWNEVIEKRRNAEVRKSQAQREQQERIEKMTAAAIRVPEQLKGLKKPSPSILPAL
jgi:hypothetical protein